MANLVNQIDNSDTKIQRLSLENVNLSQNSWNDLFSNHLHKLNSLIRLDLNGNPLYHSAIKGLCSYISGSKIQDGTIKLKYLSLKDCMIDFGQFGNIVNALFQN